MKTATLAVRLAPDERAGLEVFAKQASMTLSDAARAVIRLGLRARPVATETTLVDAMKVLCPEWSGQKPAFGKPISLTTRKGQDAVSHFLDRSK